LTEGTSRIDAFSDGVFAIAITLLVLEIRLPHAGAHGSLLADLLALWPYYFAFTLSFFVILVSWMTHHDLMRMVRATNHPIQLANGCVLIYIAFLPFPTAVLASHLGGTDVATAVTFYCGTFVFGNIAFNLLFETMARSRLFRPEVGAEAIRRIRHAFRLTGVFYLTVALIAPVTPLLALALNIAVRLHLLRIRYQQSSQSPAQKRPVAEGTSRIEAFSDGVYAIAITLLVLEIGLQHQAAEGGLRASLLALWPNYLAFALSFFVILVSWIAHHDVMRLVHVTNHPVQLANGCLLFYVTFIPFVTTVLAANLGGSEISTAVTLYCATFVFGSGAFNLLVATIGRCPGVDMEAVRHIRRGFRITFTTYIAATLLALVAPWVALALSVAVRVNLLRIRYQSAQHTP